MVKRIGPNTDPCGTPSIITVQELKAVSIFALSQRLVKQLQVFSMSFCQNYMQVIYTIIHCTKNEVFH